MDIFLPELGQISASHEAQIRTYYKVEAGGRIWLYSAIDENAGDFVYVSGGPNSQGFGGSTLTFKLVDGSSIDLRGPWHTGSTALFEATGIDIRHKHISQAIIAKGRRQVDKKIIVQGVERLVYGMEMVDVLYSEEKPVIATYGRQDVIDLAEDYARKLGHSVQVHINSFGGSVTKPVDPINPVTGRREWTPRPE